MRGLSQIIRQVKDPDVSEFTSVVEVMVAPDLKTCKVFVSVLGGEEERASTLAGLNRAKGYIRRELAHTVNLRNTPELVFIMDDSIEYGIDMSRRIREVLSEDELARSARDEIQEDV